MVVGHASTLVTEGPDLVGAVVSEEVGALQARDRRAAVDRATADRTAAAVAIRPDREGHRGRIWATAGVVGVVALVAAPAVVLAPGAGGGLEVDLFDRVLAHVRHVEVAGRAVEGAAPDVPQAGYVPNFYTLHVAHFAYPFAT